MNKSIPRKIRIAAAILWFIPTAYLFADIYSLISPGIAGAVLYLQFVPSALKFAAFLSFSTAGFIVVILSTLLFGRLYCSTVCPLGTYQDLVNYISKKFHKRKRFEFIPENKKLRLVFLFLAVVFLISGTSLALSLLDPYSIFGRFSGSILRPALTGVNNLSALILQKFKVYLVYQYDIKEFYIAPFIISLLFISFVTVLAWRRGRLYCNTVCPVGTFLGLLSGFSLFRIRINDDDCTKCGICARECKSGCINSKAKEIDLSRCVMCFDCLSSCSTGAITFSPSPVFSGNKNFSENHRADSGLDTSKRNFLTAAGIYILSASALSAQVAKKIIVTKLSTKPIFRNNPVSPPGSRSIERFNSKCTACHLCVTACPTQVLQPSWFEYGITGILQPRLDNNAGFCNFECKICGDVCPTGAILPSVLENKKLTQLGKAIFLKDNCIVFTQKTDCGACSEHCPTKAVHMIPEGNLFAPEVREDYCIGCGACEFACPVKPYKAIYVEGNRTHLTAKKNTEEKKQEKVDTKEDFPF